MDTSCLLEKNYTLFCAKACPLTLPSPHPLSCSPVHRDGERDQGRGGFEKSNRCTKAEMLPARSALGSGLDLDPPDWLNPKPDVDRRIQEARTSKPNHHERNNMKAMIHTMQCALCAVWLLAGHTAGAADSKTYQVTGPVLEVTPTTITVQKGEEKWQVARGKSTKATVEPKVGDKVTVYYTMTATEIDVKADAKGGGKKK